MQGEHHHEAFNGITFQHSDMGVEDHFQKRFYHQTERNDAPGLGIEVDSFYDFNQIEFSSFGGKTSQEHFHAELYHQQFMNMGGIEYNTAPAAYGVYNTPEMYHPLDHINPAMLDPVPYSLSPYVTPMSHYEQQSEFHHIDYEENSNVHIHHVDTNHFQIDSSQSSSDNTVEYNSTTTTTTRGRKAAEPITITSAQKLDRRTLKRLRNRVSASRCRSKKKEWITEMEEANATLHEENTMLQERISELMVSIARAKTQIAANKLS